MPLVFAGIVALSPESARAQILPTVPVRFGFAAGANITHVAGSQVSDVSNRDGWIGGVTLDLPLPSHWSVATGALYAMKGWARVEPQTQDRAVAKLDYIEFPAMLRYEFRNASPVSPFVGGGASLSFRSKCGLSATSAASAQTQDVTCAEVARLDSTFGFHSVDWGALLAGGVAADLGPSRLTLEARYEYGLTDVQKNNNARSRALALTAGISWPVGF